MAKIRATFQTDQAGLAERVTGRQGISILLASRAARRTVNHAKHRAPVDVGILRNSIAADAAPKVSGMTVETGVTASANYALPVHEGTRGGNVIRPKNAKALKFQIGQRTVFAKSVTQGPRKARPFLYNGAETAAGRMGFTVSRVP